MTEAPIITSGRIVLRTSPDNISRYLQLSDHLPLEDHLGVRISDASTQHVRSVEVHDDGRIVVQHNLQEVAYSELVSLAAALRERLRLYMDWFDTSASAAEALGAA